MLEHLKITIKIDEDYHTQKTTLKLRRACGENLQHYTNEFNYVEFRGLGHTYMCRTWNGVTASDICFIVEWARNNIDEFKSLISRHSEEEAVIKLAKIPSAVCFFRAEKTRDYRTAGENTYYQLDGELHKLEGEPISRSITSNMKKCSGCLKYVIEHFELMRHGDIGRLCCECMVNYDECETCGDVINEGCGRCDTFYSKLHGYHNEDGDKSTPPIFLFFNWIKGKFTRSTVETEGNNKRETALYIGDEHEVECEDSDEKYGVVGELCSHYRDLLFYYTKDGSLDEGLEIHSHPMTHKAHKQRNWDGFKNIREWGVRSYDTTTAGLHFHLNRSAFTNFHFLKFVKFINENIAFTLGIARRRDMSNLNDYASFNYRLPYDIKRYIARRYREFSGNSAVTCDIGGRDAINLLNKKTIELRFFGGALTENKYKAKIDFTQAVYEYTQNSSYTHQNVDEFTEFVNSNNKFRALQTEFKTDVFKSAIRYPKAQPNNLTY